jgi:predicted aspartyl protease
MMRNRTRILAIVLFGKAVLQCCDATAAVGSKKDVELPFQLLNDSLILTQGSINSVDKLNIVLDTGANCTLISSELVRSWNLQGKTESVTAMSGTSSTEAVTLSEIRIGPLIASLHRALLADLSTLSKQVGKPIAAIIGLDVLGSSNFMIDFFNRRLVFDPTKSGRHIVPFLVTEPFPAIAVNVEGQEMRLLVDSGMAYILMFRNRLDPTRCKIERVFAKTRPTITTSSGTVPATWFRAAHVSVGNGKLKEQMVLVAEDPDLAGQIDGLLGLAQTGFQKVWLNFKDNTMAWE